MDAATSNNVDALLGRIERVRALALRLVRDAAVADDLVQDALTRALGRPLALEGDPWSWIVTTLRNLARDRARGERRRERHELAGARAEASVDSARAVENAERQRELVGAVLALDEPYRTVVLLRFFEELPPRSIATRTGRSVATVKKQLERGLAQLRAKLEQRFGDRGAWAVALVPVIGTKELLAPASVVAALGLGFLVKCAGALVLLALAGVLWRWTGQERMTTPHEPVTVFALSSDSPSADTTTREQLERRVATTAQEVREQPSSPSEPRFLTARVVDLEGQPLAGVSLEWAESAVRQISSDDDGTIYWTEIPEENRRRLRTSTDAAGRFEFTELPLAAAMEGDWLVTGRSSQFVHRGTDVQGELVLVLAPTVRVAGRTIDGEGRPLAGIEVRSEMSVERLSTFPLRLSGGTDGLGGVATSDAEGRFDLGRVPTHREWRVNAGGSSHGSGSVPVPERDELDLVLVLPEIPPQVVPRVHGWVLEADGLPAPGVRVDFGQDWVLADAQGRFELDVSSFSDQRPVTARATDGRFTVTNGPSRDAALQQGGAGPFVLQLPAQMGRIQGRLVDSDQRPCAGVRVLLFDRTPLGSLLASLEGAAAGRYRDAEIFTDATGRFVLAQLLERPYRLRFVDPESLLVHDVADVRSSAEEQVFELPADGLLEELRGRVVDAHGLPLAGVKVSLVAALNDGRNGTTTYLHGRVTTTATDGGFTIRDAPWREIAIDLEPPLEGSTFAVRFPLSELDPRAPLLLEAALPCEVRVTLEDDSATHLRLLDVNGAALNVTEKHPDLFSTRNKVGRAAHGGFPLFEVSQRATTLVVLRGEEELQRVPLRLDPTQRNELELDR